MVTTITTNFKRKNMIAVCQLESTEFIHFHPELLVLSIFLLIFVCVIFDCIQKFEEILYKHILTFYFFCVHIPSKPFCLILNV